jgi:CRISPR/Cas system-associated exonuclease Cas4 (RecB family)
MPLAPDFVFSQSSLQDYVDCPRRFQLRYLLRLPWPAVEAEPFLAVERRMQQGEAFHLLVHRDLLGLERERLAPSPDDSDLCRWWAAYLESAPAGLPPERYPELSLSAELAGCRLMAKYDLLAVEPGRLVIVDWKTNRRRPGDGDLLARLQTIVYRYLLVLAGARLNGGPVLPEQVEMLYWFSEYPRQPARLPYSAQQYRADGAYLGHLAGQIEEAATAGDSAFPASPNGRGCLFCPYRSLCDRGVQAGNGEDGELEVAELEELTLDLEQVAEIAL